MDGDGNPQLVADFERGVGHLPDATPVRVSPMNAEKVSDDGTRFGRTGPPSHEESSLELLRRYRGGDHQALERLMERYLPLVRRWATGRLPPWARKGLDTEDMVQDALVQTFRNIGSFVPRHDGALRAYLRQIVHNRILEQLRHNRRKREAALTTRDEVDLDPSPLEKVIGKEAQERYESALKDLREVDREAIVMRIEMGLSYEQMAQVLCKPSPNAARMGVTRALVRLAERIAREG